MGLNLEETLRKSNAFLVEGMMTEEARKRYMDSFPHHEQQRSQ